MEEKENAPLAVSDVAVPAIATAKAEAVAKINRIPCAANRDLSHVSQILRSDSFPRPVAELSTEWKCWVVTVGMIIVLRADAHDKSHQTLANLKRQPARLRRLRSQKV